MREQATIRLGLCLMLLGTLMLGSMRTAHTQTPDPASKFRLAQGLEQAGEFERAAALYKELSVRDPQNPLYFDGLQRTLLQLKRYDEAIAAIQQRLARAPGDVSMRATLGSVLYRAGREKEANDAWNAALATEPANPNVYRMVASVLVENRLLDRAADVYRRGRAALGDPQLFTLELAQLLVASMDYAGATREYLAWLAQNPGQGTFVENRLAAFSWKPEGRAAAVAVVQAAIGDHGDSALYALLGWLYLEGKEFDRALETYRTIDRMTGSHGTGLLSFAERAYREGAYALAARAYQEALRAPLPAAQRPAAWYGYASALKELSTPSDTAAPAEGRPSAADVVKQFREIVDAFPQTDVAARSLYQIGTLLFQRSFDLDGALAAFTEAGNIPQTPRTLQYDIALRVGELLVARGDTAGAARRFTGVAAAPDAAPDQSDEAQFHLAELEFFGAQMEQAARRLEAISLNTRADYANDALALKALLDENKGAPQALAGFAHAQLLARQQKRAEAIAAFSDILTRYPQAPLVDDALMNVAHLQEAAGLHREAITSYERLLEQFKESSVALDRAQFNIGRIYDAALRDREHAIAAYEKLLAAFPSSVFADQARRRVRALRGEMP